MTHDIAADIEDPEERYTVHSAVLLEIQRRRRQAEKAQEGSKRCPACGVTKALTAFGKDRSRPDGRFRICKTCR